MSPSKLSFTIRATASRLEKGFIAIPQKFKNWFPEERSKIRLAFDDEDVTTEVTFHPHDPSGKETRVFGTKEWFSKRQIVPGDLITISVENQTERVYSGRPGSVPPRKRAARISAEARIGSHRIGRTTRTKYAGSPS